jgi:hypothetical protein
MRNLANRRGMGLLARGTQSFDPHPPLRVVTSAHNPLMSCRAEGMAQSWPRA